MTLAQRFARLSFWNKFGFIAGLMTIAGFVLCILFWLFPRYLPPVRTLEATANAPLRIRALVSPAPPYGEGENIAGILWMPNFVDVRVHLENANKTILRDVDLQIAPDTFIADARQIGTVADVRLIPSRAGPDIWLSGTDTNNKPKGFAVVPPAGMQLPLMSQSLRVHCPSLLPGASLDLILATCALNPPKPNGGFPDTFFSASRSPPTAIRIYGTYVDDQRAPALRYNVEKTISFH